MLLVCNRNHIYISFRPHCLHDPGLYIQKILTKREMINCQNLNFLPFLTRAATFTSVNSTILRFCNKRLQNWPTVYTNIPHDQRRGLLIAFSNEHPALDHQTVCLFSQIQLYLIKYLLQLELRWT